MVFIAAVASSIWCQPAGSGTGTVFRTTHAQGFLPSPERDKSESIPVCSNQTKVDVVWFMVMHKVTVEGSQLFAYHALDTICGRPRPRPSARPLGAFVVAAAATALPRKEGERGRGCARGGGGGGCEDDYPEGGRPRGQFRGLFH